MSVKHTGTCFCGSVEIEVEGEPAAMGYCHCTSCRHWSAGPVNAFTLWDPDKVRITRGAEFVAQYNKTRNSDRKWCTKCGGHLMAGHPGMKLVDVYAAVIPTVEFAPGLHVHYAETVLPIKDGLPKFRDIPADIGGTGETMAE